MTRQTWDEYFIGMTKLVSERGTCLRKKVGCVLVKDNKIIATGYNGAPKGLTHCTEAGCIMEDGHCIRTIHAEQNALLQVGPAAEGSTLYITMTPCPICFKSLIQAGVKRVVYVEDYNRDDISYWILEGKIKVEQWKDGQVERYLPKMFKTQNEYDEYLSSVEEMYGPEIS